MSSNTVSNELPNGQTKTIDFSNQDKNSNMHASSSQTKQDPIEKSLTSLQEKNNPSVQNHENTLNRHSENQEQNSQKDQSDKTPSSPSKEDLQPSNTDSINSFDVDGSKSGRNYIGHSKKQGSREYSSWKSRNSVQQTKQPKNKRKDDVKPEPIPLQDLNSWPTLEQARSTETASKKTNESTTPKSPKAAPFTQSGEEKQDEGDIQSPKKKGINWVPFKEALNPTGSSSSGSTSPPSTAPLSSQTSGNPREGRSSNNSTNRGRGSRRRSDKDNSDEFYQRQSREGQQQTQGGRNWRSGGQYRNSGNRGYSNRQFNNSNVGGFPYLYTLEGEQLREAILYQIEYYYSVENLVRDVWLRSQWDEEGWLSLSVVASFPRIRALTTDLAALAEALKSSTILEYKDDKIRKLDDWKNWILPKTLIPQVDSPITSLKSNEQNVSVTNSVENMNSNNNLNESSENSQQSPNPTPASQTQPATRTYASLASADAQKQKQNKPQQRKQEAPKKAATPQKQKSEPKKQESASSTTSEPKKENTTENKPATEEGEWQTVEVKKRRSVQKVPSRKELPKKFEETNGVGDENHVVSPNAARKEKHTQ